MALHLKSKKIHVNFWISVGKQKNPRKIQKSKSFGPRRKVLDFWIFGFWFPRRNVWSLEMFLACEYRHIHTKADMSRHDVVKRHDFHQP